MPWLEWHKRDDDLKATAKTPYRLLQPIQSLSYGDEDAPNMLIQGDNLEALKALLPYYAGQVKCIFIDPPYNTKSAFEHYDDNLEHAQWLSMMYPRMVLLRELLREDGSIWITLDDNESHYFKVMCDEIFGRRNFINQISVKTKNTAGASGGGEDKRLKKNVETLLVYVKNNNSSSGGFNKFNDVYEEINLFDLIDEMEDEGKSWKYTSVLQSYGDEIDRRVVKTGDGEDITVRKVRGVQRTTVKAIERSSGRSREEIYSDNFERIFSDTNAQTSIRTRIIDEFMELKDDEMLIASYTPRSGRDKGRVVEHFYISPTIRRVIWLKDTAEKKKNYIIKKDKLGTLWTMFNWNNVSKEGGVRLPNGKKPEALIKAVLDLATQPGDLVLDSFLGSGTTAAAAHKMGRRWIGVEIGEQARSHCQPRLSLVVDGDDGGISEQVGWKGGGGFRFYQLGPKVFDDQGRINPEIKFEHLAAHIWFAETGTARSTRAMKSPLLDVHNGTAYYLLYNGILGDQRLAGGNMLTMKVLAGLPKHDGPMVIYGEGTNMTNDRLRSLGIKFKKTPNDIRAR
ncbi:MAG: site-specific DNA-methyltransferase [Dokdonella sp.]|uniref:site-specific DNA-methyltransferase n=1 Tax=Dokdonella sp. TaxID=2291710 RepID=UPI003BAFE9F7